MDHADLLHTYADLCRHCEDIMQTHTRLHLAPLSVVISDKVSYCALVYCRTYVVSKGRIRAGCFPALRRVEKQEEQGKFGRYAPVQYLEEGTIASPDDSFFAWWI